MFLNVKKVNHASDHTIFKYFSLNSTTSPTELFSCTAGLLISNIAWLFGRVIRFEWAIVIECNPFEDEREDAGGLLTTHNVRFVNGK